MKNSFSVMIQSSCYQIKPFILPDYVDVPENAAR